jgi:polar amino acid transport system substrate-binding protein
MKAASRRLRTGASTARRRRRWRPRQYSCMVVTNAFAAARTGSRLPHARSSAARGIVKRSCGKPPRRCGHASSSIARIAIVLIPLIASCGLPRDTDGTLNHVRGGVLRVGVSLNSPWTTRSDTALAGTEVHLVNELAHQIGARPTWRVGTESTLLAALEARQLDLVIGGLTSTSPWAGRVALTRPYDAGGTPSHVMATSPGENAWLVHVEGFLEMHPTTPSD